MRLSLAVLAVSLVLIGGGEAAARGHSGGSNSYHYHAPRTYHPHVHSVPGLPRDNDGHIRRSHAAKGAFERSHPCPSTGKSHGRCPGYVVDHVVPLKRGGPDNPSNMQWQTIQDAKAKDRTE